MMDTENGFENLQMARFGIGLMAGTMSVEEIRTRCIKEVMGDSAVKYEELDAENKANCDEVVGIFQQMSGLFRDVISARAVLTKSFYNELIKSGFSSAEALAITAAQPVETKF